MSTPIEDAKRADGTIDPEKLKAALDEAAKKDPAVIVEWALCRRCGQRHRGLGFACWAKGEAIRCPICSGLVREMTAAEIKEVKDEERRAKHERDKKDGE